MTHPSSAQQGARPATPMDEIAELHSSGRLAVGYPRACELTSRLADAELARAGQFLARIDPGDVARAHPTIPIVDLAVTGHGTVAPLLPALAAEFARHGLLPRIRLSDFDSYVFDLAPGGVLYAERHDLVLCLLDPAMVFDEVPSPWRAEDAARALAGKVDTIARLAATFAASSQGILVLNTIPLPADALAQLVDLRSRARLAAAWRDCNARLLRLVDAHPSVAVLDLEPLLGQGASLADPRMSIYAKAHLSAGLLAGYARQISHLARSVAGHTKKCLALDLDGTMWGGVLGDDGPEALEIADGYRGEAFRVFQKVARQLGAQGVLLAAVSKNDLAPVQQALREHPRMTVREDDFVRIAANWRPKADNLRELATDLNLGVDSFVFVDDSPFECGLIREELPEVATIQVDGEPALHASTLLREGWFDQMDLTIEDTARPARYRDELARQDFLRSFQSIEDYLGNLGVEVRLANARDEDLARVSQITLRTNQFNLTGERLGPAEVTALAADPAWRVLTIHASDRFGDNGLVGVILLSVGSATLTVSNMLLSCRVFSRGIEQACMAAVLRHARDLGAASVVGVYRQTVKNTKMRDFYPLCGFTAMASDGERELTFRHNLGDILAPPPYVRLTDLQGESSS
jgi:FkbH-like protein